MTKIVVTLNKEVTLQGKFLENELGEKFAKILPFEIEFDTWGDELYGVLEKDIEKIEGDRQDIMDVGDIAYHPENKWFCIFWGPTPSSRGNEIRAAVPVIKIGEIHGDFQKIYKLKTPIKGVIEKI